MSLRSETALETDGFEGNSRVIADGLMIDALVAGDASLVIGDGAWVLGASFDRQGFDLIIEGDEDKVLLLRDYFAQSDPATLSLDGGEAILRGSVVERLAGPVADG